MRSELFRLRASELRLLTDLYDSPQQDAVGKPIDELNDHQRILAEELETAGLVRFDIGWRGMGWYRLTTLGHELVRAVWR